MRRTFIGYCCYAQISCLHRFHRFKKWTFRRLFIQHLGLPSGSANRLAPRDLCFLVHRPRTQSQLDFQIQEIISWTYLKSSSYHHTRGPPSDPIWRITRRDSEFVALTVQSRSLRGHLRAERDHVHSIKRIRLRGHRAELRRFPRFGCWSRIGVVQAIRR